MVKTLPQNYQRNMDILKENLKRGLTYDMAMNTINSMQKQFINANLYNQLEQDYINELKAIVLSHFTMVDINIVK